MWRTGLLAPSVPLAHNMFRIVKGNPNCKIFCRHNARNAVSVTAWKIKVWVHAYLASKLSIWSSREKSRECLVQAVHLSLDMLWSRWWFIHPNSGFFLHDLETRQLTEWRITKLSLFPSAGRRCRVGGNGVYRSGVWGDARTERSASTAATRKRRRQPETHVRGKINTSPAWSFRLR